MSANPEGGGFLESCQGNAFVFQDSRVGDILLYTDSNSQSILLGAQPYDKSGIRVSSNMVYMNNNVYVSNAIGLGASNVTNMETFHRLTVVGPSNSVLGPNTALFTNDDMQFPAFQHYVASHNQQSIGFDTFITCSSNNTVSNPDVWKSADSNLNVRVQKVDSKFMISTSCNATPGTEIPGASWRTAISIDSNSFVGIGSCNASHRLTVRAEDSSMMGPHVAMYTSETDPNPVFQQLNWTHNDISQNFDVYYDSSQQWISADSNANFRISKNQGKLSMISSCNIAPGTPMTDADFRVAFSINSNSYIGIGTSNPTSRLTLSAEDSSVDGPHVDIRTSADDYPLVYQRNWTHDDIAQGLDTYWDSSSNVWKSSTSNANIRISKKSGQYVIATACNVTPGDDISESSWKSAITINSNSFVGIGSSSNITHRFTLNAESNSMTGPHMAIYTSQDSNFPIYQQRNWAHDDIAQSYDAYFDGSNWVSASSQGNFRVMKKNGKFTISSACNVAPGTTISSEWRDALSVSRNSFVGIGTSDPKSRLTIQAEDASTLGPHAAFYVASDSNHPVMQIRNWSHDDVSINFDTYWDGTSWVSSSSNGNFRIAKSNGGLSIFASSNANVGSTLSQQKRAVTVAANGYVAIGDTVSPETPLHVAGKTFLETTTNGPSIGVYGGNADKLILEKGTSATHPISIGVSNAAVWQSVPKGASHTWMTDGVEKIRISPEGFLGIGTQAPETLLHLSINTSNKITFSHASNMTGFKVGLDDATNANGGGGVIWNASNAHIKFGTSNEERMRITAKGSLGLGTTTPTTLFQMTSNSANTISLTNDSNTQGFKVGIEDAEIANGGGGIIWNASNAHIKLGTSDIERARITSTGAIGIGTSSPTSLLHLASNTSNKITYTSDSNTIGFTIGLDDTIIENGQGAAIWNAQNSYVRIGTNDVERLRVTNTGALGIGTSGPSSIIHTHSNTSNIITMTNTSNTQGVSFGIIDASSPEAGNAIISNKSNASIIISTNEIERMRISPDGSLGIGTSNPISKLHLYSNVANAVIMTTDSNTTGVKFGIEDASLGEGGYIWNTGNAHIKIGTSNEERARFTSTGALGLGTSSPSSLFHMMSNVSNVITFTNASNPSGVLFGMEDADDMEDNGGALIWNLASNSHIKFGTSNVERMRLTQKGHLGIGSSNAFNILTLTGPPRSLDGPNVMYHFDDPTRPAFQHYNASNDDIAMTFDGYWDGGNWRSSSSNGNFQIVKRDGRFTINSATFAEIGDTLDNTWFPALTVNSNGNIGINTTDAEYGLDVHSTTFFRSNVFIGSNLLPSVNMGVDLGSEEFRFKDLYLSGNSIDLEGVKLQKDYENNGLIVFDSFYSTPARVWVKELFIGDPSDMFNSNVFLMTPSSNGVKFANFTSNIPPQDFTQMNNFYVTQTKAGIGLSNPEKSFQVIGNVEINPYIPLFTDNTNTKINVEAIDLIPLLSNNQNITSWGTYLTSQNQSNTPAFKTQGGLHDAPYVHCSSNVYFTTKDSLSIDVDTNQGFTAMMLVRLYAPSVNNEKIFQFSNANGFLSFGRSGTSDKLSFTYSNSMNNVNAPFITPANTIGLNEWTWITARYDAFTQIFDVSKNVSFLDQNLNQVVVPLYSNIITSMCNMTFTPNDVMIGNGNIDIASFKFFDRAVFDSEIIESARSAVYSGNSSFKIQSTYRQYPPIEFRVDENGWVNTGLKDGGRVYEKVIRNSLYGNGTYKIWATDEETRFQNTLTYNVLNNNSTSSWLTSKDYVITQDAMPAPTLYIECPVPIKLQAYSLTASSEAPTRTPSRWVVYGSTNGLTWSVIDRPLPQQNWINGEQRIFYTNSCVAYKQFKFEILRNTSFMTTGVEIENLNLYGSETSFNVDGSGLASGVGYTKERLTIEGNAIISQNTTLGKTSTEPVPNIYQIPQQPMFSNVSLVSEGPYAIGNGEFIVTASSYSGYNTPDCVFDHQPSYPWQSGDNYDGETGLYTSSAVTTALSGATNSNYSGEWLQVSLPKPVGLRAYTMQLTDLSYSSPNAFAMLGSTDNTQWVTLDARNQYPWPQTSTSEPEQFNIHTASNGVYSHYRIVIPCVGDSSLTTGRTRVSIGDLKFIVEDPNATPVAPVGVLNVHGDTNIYGQMSIGSNVIPTGSILGLNVRTLLATNTRGSKVQNWNNVSQEVYKYQPALFGDNGHKDIPYVSFVRKNNTHFKTASMQLNMAANGGFTFVVLANFQTSRWDGAQETLLDLGQAFDDPNNRLTIAISPNTDYFTISLTDSMGTNVSWTSPAYTLKRSEWAIYGFTYNHKTKQGQIYVNDKKIETTFNGTVEQLDQVVKNTTYTMGYIGKSLNISNPGYDEINMDMSAMYLYDHEVPQIDMNRLLDYLVGGMPQSYLDKKIRLKEGIDGNLVISAPPDVHNRSMVLRYPPRDPISQTEAIYNSVYGNGVYKYTSSSQSDDAYKAFTTSPSYWVSGSNFTPGSTRSTYNGASVTYVPPWAYFQGEFLQIELPEPVLLEYFTIKPSPNWETTAPRYIQVVASQNGFDFVTIDESTYYWESDAPMKMIPTYTITTPYKYYRMVVYEGNGATNIEVCEFGIYGRAREVFVVNSNVVMVSGNLGVNTTNPTQPLDVAGNARIGTSNGLGYVTIGSGLVDGVDVSALSKRVKGSLADTSKAVSKWKLQIIPSNNAWCSVCWSPELGVFVAVADTGVGNRVMTSYDGILWMTQTTPVDNGWYSVCWSSKLGMFVAVSYNGVGNQVMTSPNGFTWTTQATPVSNNWNSVCWSPELGIFVAVSLASGTANNVMTSSNGITWTSRTTPDKDWYSVCWSAEVGVFVAVGYSSYYNAENIMISPDGISWTIVKSLLGYSPQISAWYSVCWSPELSIFVATGTNTYGSNIITSKDGVNWTAQNVGFTQDWWNVTWVPELSVFVAVSNATSVSTSMITSTDGITWTSQPVPISNTWFSVCWSRELSMFVVVSRVGSYVLTSATPAIPSSKGTLMINVPQQNVMNTLPGRMRVSRGDVNKGVSSWTTRTSPSISYQSICWSPELSIFVAVGTATSNGIATSPDGINWTTRILATNYSYTSVCWSPQLSLFVIVSDTNSGATDKIATSSDGITWTTRSSITLLAWKCVCWSPELSMFVVVAGSGSGNQVLTSSDGINWNTRTTPTPALTLTSVCWSSELLMFCAIGLSCCITSTDGINWTSRTIISNYWRSICWSPELYLFVSVASSGTGNRIMTSPNGVNWTARNTTGIDNDWWSVTWSPELSIFIACSNNGLKQIMVSSNGISWNTLTTTNATWRSIIWSKELSIFVVVAFTPAIMTTTNPILPASRSSLLVNQSLINVDNSIGSLNVNGPVSFSNTLGVSNVATFTSNVFVRGTTVITGSTTYSNPVTALSNLSVNGPVSFSNTLGVSNTAFFSANVGIGTTTPSTTLDVNGKIRGTSYVGAPTANNTTFTIDIAPSTSNTVFQMGSSNLSISAVGATGNWAADAVIGDTIIRATTGSMRFLTGNGAAPSTLVLQSGRIGIANSNPTGLLHLASNTNNYMTFTNASNQTGVIFGTENISTGGGGLMWNLSNAHLSFGTSNIERMRLTSNGNVGIGTSNPQQTLDIQGSIRFGTSNVLGYVTLSNGCVDGVDVSVLNNRVRVSRAEANAAVSTWTTRSSVLNNNWYSVTWASSLGIFVAVAWTGAGANVMTSTDGITWISRSIPVDNFWNSIVWSPELSLFVVTSNGGVGNRVMTSSDGVTWTTQSTPVDNSWYSVCWSPELSIFVAVATAGGVNNKVMTSSDGTTWITRSCSNNNWRSVCWSSELRIFVAVAETGSLNRVMTSLDGINWTTRSTPVDNTWRCICWSPELGMFVSVANSGTGNRVMTSPDGLNWVTRTTSIDNSWQSICWSPELSIFVVVAHDAGIGNRIMTSSDGIVWTTRTSPADIQWQSVCWSKELSIFVAVADSGTGNRVMTTRNPALPSSKSTILVNPSYMTVNNTNGFIGLGGNSNPSYTLDITGGSRITSNLFVNGPVSFSNTLGVSNVATFASNVIVTGNINATTYSNIQWSMINNVPSFATAGGFNAIPTNVTYTMCNVGVNTSNPTTTLDVNGSIKAVTYCNLDWSMINNIPSLEKAGGFNAVPTSVTYTLCNVGIGTSNPVNTLHVQGTVRFENSNNIGVTLSNGFVDGVDVAVLNKRVRESRTQVITGLSTWTVRKVPGYYYWSAICWSPDLGMFASITTTGGTNQVTTSLDGTTWTLRNTIAGGPYSWRAIVWSSELGLFAAVAYNSVVPVMTSPDGINWTSRTAINSQWGSICWSPELGIFVAVSSSGTGNRAMTSSDGVTWTTRTTPDLNWWSVCWSPELSLFVAVASSGTGTRAMTSPDGINWTLRNTPVDNNWYSVVWAGELGLFVSTALSGTGNRVMTSPDGITWTTRTSAGDFNWGTVIWAQELSVLIAISVSGFMTSFDGITWTFRASPANINFSSIAWSRELSIFAVVGSPGGTSTELCMSTSYPILPNPSTTLTTLPNQIPTIRTLNNRVRASRADATTSLWATRTSAVDNAWQSVCWSPQLSLLVAVASSGTGNRIMVSNNGINWVTRSNLVDNNWESVCWSPELNLFVAVADSGTTNRVMTSPDGLTWTTRTTVSNNWSFVCWSPEMYMFVAVAYSGTGNRVMTSSNGTTWTTRTSAADNDWRSVCWSGDMGMFVAVASSGTGNGVMISFDGVTWTTSTPAVDNAWYGVCWSPELSLFVAVANTGTLNRIMTSPDGVTWSSRASVVDNNWSSVCWSQELSLFVAVANGEVVVKYPASGINGATNSAQTINGITYTVTDSSPNNSAYNAFDESAGSFWEPLINNTYTNGGFNTTTPSTTYGASLTYAGEWIQLQMTRPITVTNYSITARSGYLTRAPGDFKLFASSDGAYWVEIDSRTGITYPDTNPVSFSPASQILTYTYFRIGINKLAGTTATDIVPNIAEIAFNGIGVSIANRIIVSSDGITWTTRQSIKDNAWNSICWARELSMFVTVASSGTGNRVMTSRLPILPASKSTLLTTIPQQNALRTVNARVRPSRADANAAISTWTTQTSFNNNWISICWSSELGIFCAVSYSGTLNRVMTSPDGINWTTRTTPVDVNWNGICWSPDLSIFVVVGTTGTGQRIMTSPDGVTWTSRTNPVNNTWRCVCWSSDLYLFVAVSSDGVGNGVMTSPDGINWTSRSVPSNQYLSVTWASELGLFVVVGNVIVTSSDGITWTTRSMPTSNTYYSVCWAAELCLLVAVASTGTLNRVMTSPDGIIWTSRATPLDNNWYNVCWSPELSVFVAIANNGNGNVIMTSHDGAIWTTRSTPNGTTWWSICWSRELGVFAAIAANGTTSNVMISRNPVLPTYRTTLTLPPQQVTAIKSLNTRVKASRGDAITAVSNWVTRTSPADNDWRSVCWSSELGIFVAVASLSTVANTRIMTSQDGVNWVTRTNPVDNAWQSVCWAPELSLFVAVSSDGTLNQVMTSPDGITWTSRATPVNNTWKSVCWAAELYLFVAVADSGGSGNRVMTSTNGTTWTTQTSAANQYWSSVCWSPELSLFVAVNATTSQNMVMISSNGITWTTVAGATNNIWNSVCWSSELGIFAAIAASGANNRIMTSPDGINWVTRTTNNHNWGFITWSPDLSLFLATSYLGTNRLMTSPDGITWTTRTPAVDNNFTGACWSRELSMFVVIANSGTGNRVATTRNPALPATKSTILANPSFIRVNNTNGFLGVGTSNPQQVLHIQDTYTGSWIPTIRLERNFDDVFCAYVEHFKSRGAASNRTVVLANDMLASSIHYGYDGTTYRAAAEIATVMASNASTNDVGARLVFKTRNVGVGQTLDEKMTILPNGFVGVGTLNPIATLDVQGTAHIMSGSNRIATTFNRLSLGVNTSNATSQLTFSNRCIGRIHVTTYREDSGLLKHNNVFYDVSWGSNTGAPTVVSRILDQGNNGLISHDWYYNSTACTLTLASKRNTTDGSFTFNYNMQGCFDNSNPQPFTTEAQPSGTLVNNHAMSFSNKMLGIGTNNPVALLHMTSNASNVVLHTNSVNTSGVVFGIENNATGGGGMIWNTSNAHLSFGTSNVERMRIISSGQVFIGDVSYFSTSIGTAGGKSNCLVFDGSFDLLPSTGTPANKIRLQNVSNWVAGLGISAGQVNYHSGQDHVWWSATTNTSYGTEVMRVASTGNVGIGTSNPGATLDVNGKVRASSYTGVPFANNNVVYIDQAISTSNTVLQFGTASLGTSNLAIVSPIGVNGNWATDTQVGDTLFRVSTGALRFSIGTGTNPSTLVLQSGRIGIANSNPSGLLHLGSNANNYMTCTNVSNNNGVIFGIENSATGGGGVIWNTSNAHLSLGTNNTERMRILANGNVAIGTNTTSYNLHVVGTIYATGDITAFSDARKKTNVEVIDNALTKLDSINGYTFNVVTPSNAAIEDSRRHAGVIAQEIEQVIPEVIYEDAEGFKSVAYGNLSALIIQAVKELKKECTENRKEMQSLKEQVAILINRLDSSCQ